VDDYISGIKALLYLENIEDLKEWRGQSPPIFKHQKGKTVQPARVNNEVSKLFSSGLRDFFPTTPNE